nr:helix-turn-helix domain-containing protein [uncultured Rhodopila sp.]
MADKRSVVPSGLNGKKSVAVERLPLVAPTRPAAGADPEGSASPPRPGKAAKPGSGGHERAPPAAAGLTSLLTVPEAARQLRLSTRTLARAIALGQVKAVYFGRAVRLRRSEVERLAETGLPAPARRKRNDIKTLIIPDS